MSHPSVTKEEMDEWIKKQGYDAGWGAEEFNPAIWTKVKIWIDNTNFDQDNMISASIFINKKLIARMSANSQTEIRGLTEVATKWLMRHYKVMGEQLVIKIKHESVK